MTEDYLKYWSLSKPPFSLTPDPEMLYLSNQHSECLMRLKYAIFSHKGGALLVSDNAGNGKTTILAKLKKDLNDYYSGRVKVVFIDHPTLSPIEMIGEIGNQLGTEVHTNEKIKALNSLRDRLFVFYNENVKVIVIVDEGQMLKERADILDELRILLNFCVSDAFLLTFIFSGQKPLDTILRGMPEFWQRLPVRYFLKNLDFNDTKALVQYRLKKVGGSEDLFNEDAYDGIYNYSKGCPRVICSVADLCLIIGFSKGVKRIGFVEVSTACRDMESSGDGFHYFAFLKSQQYDLFGGYEKPELYQPPSNKKSEKKSSKPKHLDPLKKLSDSVICLKCAGENLKDSIFCTHCESPLYQKCPKCLKLVETFTNECPLCNTDIIAEAQKNLGELRIFLKKNDILEGNYDLWLKSKSINLHENETVIVIFPKGNFFTKGPEINSINIDKTEKKEGDVILTDSRLIICTETETAESELFRIDTCIVSDNGKKIAKKYSLLIGFNSGRYEIYLPFGSSDGRKIITKISQFIHSVMLK